MKSFHLPGSLVMPSFQFHRSHRGLIYLVPQSCTFFLHRTWRVNIYSYLFPLSCIFFPSTVIYMSTFTCFFSHAFSAFYLCTEFSSTVPVSSFMHFSPSNLLVYPGTPCEFLHSLTYTEYIFTCFISHAFSAFLSVIQNSHLPYLFPHSCIFFLHQLLEFTLTCFLSNFFCVPAFT